jgi:hypothetical protein
MEPYVAKTFAPIFLGTFRQDSFDVGQRIARVPTLAELTARLGALPPDALHAAVLAEPEIYKATIAEARDIAEYLRLLAGMFSELADRLESVTP